MELLAHYDFTMLEGILTALLLMPMLWLLRALVLQDRRILILEQQIIESQKEHAETDRRFAAIDRKLDDLLAAVSKLAGRVSQ